MSDFRRFCIGYAIISTITYWIVRLGGDPNGHSHADGLMAEVSAGLMAGTLLVALFGRKSA